MYISLMSAGYRLKNSNINIIEFFIYMITTQHVNGCVRCECASKRIINSVFSFFSAICTLIGVHGIVGLTSMQNRAEQGQSWIVAWGLNTVLIGWSAFKFRAWKMDTWAKFQTTYFGGLLWTTIIQSAWYLDHMQPTVQSLSYFMRASYDPFNLMSEATNRGVCVCVWTNV